MKLRKVITTLLCLVLLLSCIPASAAKKKEMPYRITVDLTNQIVTVYSNEDDSIVRQMLCSTGLKGSTPRGTYLLPKTKKETERQEWFYFSAFDCYAHYATRIFEGIMFHSIPYDLMDESTISIKALSEYGNPASHGCVRLYTEDAQFIAMNCLAGTECKIYRSNDPNPDLRAVLYESAYTLDCGMSYKEFLGFSDDPGMISSGDKGTEVRDLQYRLRALGFFTDEIDGIYGGNTVVAVKNLQRTLNEPRTGSVDSDLQALIYSSDAPTAMNVTLQEGHSGPAVRALQENLAALRIYNSELDSAYDVEVVEAVQLFQQAYGYPADGAATPEVQQAIHYEVNKLAAFFGEDTGFTCTQTTEEMQVSSVASQISIRIRSKPTTGSSAMGRVTDGTYLIILEKQGEWCRVRRGENVGFMMGKYLDPVGDRTTCFTYTASDGSRVYTLGHTVDGYAAGADFPAELFSEYLAAEHLAEHTVGSSAAFATVCTDSDDVCLNLREDPNTSGTVLAELPNGTQLEVLLQSAEWTLVNYEGTNGYLLNDYLEFWNGPSDALSGDPTGGTASIEAAALEDSYDETIYALVECKDKAAYVYDIDSDDAEKIGSLAKGKQVTIVETDDDWSLIDYKGKQGYMRNSDLEFILTGEA